MYKGKRSFNIQGNTVDCNSRTFVIAEVGVNHNGNFELVKKLITKAKESGADAVKFQLFKTHNLISDRGRRVDYGPPTKRESETVFEMFNRLEFKKKWIIPTLNIAHREKILVFFTPFSEEDVDILEEVNMPVYKISSGDVNHVLLIKKIARTKKPIIISSGKSTLSQIKESIDWIQKEGNSNIALLHCISSYPAPYESMNLSIINLFQNLFPKYPIGLSDHSIGILAAPLAVALGAQIVEKHFTLDNKLAGPDHWFSLNPRQFKKMVKDIKIAKSMLGCKRKEILNCEKDGYKYARRSIVAACDIRAGKRIRITDIAFKRPGYGMEPKMYKNLIGKRAKKHIKQDSLIHVDYLI
jgi:N,N'-diacetyllegionaminate synthase